MYIFELFKKAFQVQINCVKIMRTASLNGIKSMLESTQKTIVQTILESLEGVSAIYIFGSQVDGSANNDSDYDIALHSPARPNPEKAFLLKSQLSSRLNSDVDLVDLVRADTVTQAQVIAFGKRIFAKQPTEMDFFETTVLSKYAILNEERKEILESITQEGSIYGG